MTYPRLDVNGKELHIGDRVRAVQNSEVQDDAQGLTGVVRSFGPVDESDVSRSRKYHSETASVDLPGIGVREGCCCFLEKLPPDQPADEEFTEWFKLNILTNKVVTHGTNQD